MPASWKRRCETPGNERQSGGQRMSNVNGNDRADVSNRSLLESLFGQAKPVIAMMHLLPLPGRPLYDSKAGMTAIVDALRRDLDILQDGGVDGLLFCNEGDRPYTFRIDRAPIAAMAAVIGELRPHIRLPYGIDLLWDPLAAIAVAQAVQATFVREVSQASTIAIWGCGNRMPPPRWTTGGKLARSRCACFSISSLSLRGLLRLAPLAPWLTASSSPRWPMPF